MRTFVRWIATLICSMVLVAAAQGQPVPVPPPCVPVDGCPPANEWYTYRYNNARTGVQPYASALSDPVEVHQNLSVKWEFTGGGAFQASPIVVDDTVFIGDGSGIFWAIDAATGALKWRYPKPPAPPLLGSCNAFGRYGIQSSATFAVIRGQRVVIFGAPDPTAEGGLGSAALFAVSTVGPNAGNLIWKSEPLAHVSGCTRATGGTDPSADRVSLTERHERIAYSSPLVLGNKVYVGVHDAGDNPIQNGKVVAVDLNTGLIDRQFNTFVATDRRGGGVWNSLATDSAGVYFTTGNTRTDAAGDQQTEPNPNHGLSMIRIDKATGSIIWKFQPVPFPLDDDADWAAGAAVMSASCGELIASVQKDGWSYAIEAERGPSCPLSEHSWQFPPIREWTTNGCKFPDYEHGDDGYKRPGAAWNDVFIVNTGGEARADGSENVTPGYGQLHALNACATTEHDRVRWIADIPGTSPTNPHLPRSGNSIGAPTVTGGLVYIGTDLGHLIVLADPSIASADGWRCSNVSYPTSLACLRENYAIVPIPKLVKDVAVWDGGNIAGLRKEAALAKGRVFVATLSGHVYMLDTRRPTAQCLRCCANNLSRCQSECSGTPDEIKGCRQGCSRSNERCVANRNLGIECVEPSEVRP